MSSDHATGRCIYVVRNQSPFIAENIQTNYSRKMNKERILFLSRKVMTNDHKTSQRLCPIQLFS